MGKIYLQQNVYDAANERLSVIFNEFEKIVVAFSGGKDSGVLLNLALQHAKKRDKKIAVMFVDLEAQYKLTIEYVERMYRNYADFIDPYWICLPINLRNSVSVYNPFWCCWEQENKEKWVRELPIYPVINDESFFPFYKHRMEFEEFVPIFSTWYSGGKKTACLVGIRSDESLNRFRTIASGSKTRYKNYQWTTLIDQNTYNAYPIYDWRTEDIWTCNAKEGFDYNKLYDMFYKAGISIHEMRICQPYGDDQRIGLDLFRVIEPETWAKVVNRVSGANFGNIYCGTKMLGYRQVKLPEGHSWRSYTKLLLRSLPPEVRANYIDRFRKFIKCWKKSGSAVSNESLKLLPKEAVICDQKTNRGKKDKQLVRFTSIPDTVDQLESSREAPTWRRMACCILKNDHLCKSLSFTQTHEQILRMKQLVEKYKKVGS